jgi:acyl-coenzyme A synthetase/AMP-(fatty) acid ligase
MWSSSKTGAVESVSWLEFGRAIHRVAHAVRPERIGHDGDIVGIIVNTDTLLYVAVHLGLMKAGLVVSFYYLAAHEGKS